MTAVTSLRGPGPAPTEELVNPIQLARRRNLAIFLVVIGLLSGWAFALNVPSRQHANLLVTPSLGPTLKLAAWYLPVQTTNLVLSVVTLACGAWMLARRRGTQTYALLSLGLVAFGFALVIWAGRGSQVSFIGLLTTAAVYSVPLIFGSLSGVLCERSGVINIAIEGQFLAGAFLGAMFGSLTHDLWIGMIAGALAGALMGALLAFLALRYQADQVIVGVVIVTFATGLTNFLSDGPLSTHQNTLNSPAVFRAWGIPGLDKIPFVGPVVFNQNIFWYLALGILVVVQVGLSSTRWGLRVKAVGEHPEAAESVGINVLAIRYRNVIVGGAVGGLGGAAFTIGSVGQFTAGISSGLGYVALAAMIFGGWRPLRAAAACLLFGFSDSLQNTLGLLNTPIPSALLAMLPYLITIVAVAGLVGRVRPPASDGIPYKRQ